jgi:large subunit ribosomal protein L22
MRLIANIIRYMNVNKALEILKYSKKHCAVYIKNIIYSALSNFEIKYKNHNIYKKNLYIKEIKIDNGSITKRMRPAPRGISCPIKKRSNHITIMICS